MSPRKCTFRPVARLYRFKTDDEAINMANDTEFGLAAYFYSRDIGRIWRVAEWLEYGIVGINECIISTEIAPFGGIKESGIGPNLTNYWGSKYGLEDSSKSNTSAWAASTANARLPPGLLGSPEPLFFIRESRRRCGHRFRGRISRAVRCYSTISIGSRATGRETL